MNNVQDKILRKVIDQSLIKKHNNKLNLSLADGIAGELYFLANQYTVERSNELKEKAIYLFNSIKSYDLEITEEELGLWVGPLGVSLMADLWEKISDDIFFSENNMNLYAAIHPILDYWMDLDLSYIVENDMMDHLYGISGLLTFLSIHSLASYDNKYIDSMRNKVNSMAVNDSYDYLFRLTSESRTLDKNNDVFFNINFEKESIINVGLSHGLLGFLIALCNFSNKYLTYIDSKIIKEKINKYLQIINEFIEYQYQNNKMIKIPEFIKINNNSIVETYYLTANYNYSWCYGLVGFLISSLLSKKSEEIILDNLKIHLNRIICHAEGNKLRSNKNFCHGISGIIYAIYLKEKDYFEKNNLADKFYKFRQSEQPTYENQKDGLLNGNLGFYLIYLLIVNKSELSLPEIFGQLTRLEGIEQY